MTALKTMTAREIRETVPDPATLNIVPIPGKLRRELFRSMQLHSSVEFKLYCHAFDVTAGSLTRDLYFQIASMIDFPINEWLEREGDILAGERRSARQRDMTAARAGKSKLAVATELLESLGYAWHGATNQFVKLPEAW